jgi:hypothetical protein
MSIELLLGIVIFGGVVMLVHCRRIQSDVAWLKSKFMSEREKGIRLPHELRRLAPLCFFPLADTADELMRMYDATEEEWTRKLNELEHLELIELKAFAATAPPPDWAFHPSDALNDALKRWAVAVHKLNTVGKWQKLFTKVFLEVLNGKLSIEDAEESFTDVSQFRLSLIEEFKASDGIDDSETANSVEQLFNHRASFWEAGARRRRLESLLSS